VASEDIIITYETLYDILMNEKKSNEIQKLDNNFLEDVLNYFKEKSKLIQINPDSIFGAEEQKKALQQLDNAKRLLKEIYAWREKKILLLSRDASRTNDHLINKSVLLIHEKVMFEEFLKLLKRNRENILDNLMLLKEPVLADSSSFSSPMIDSFRNEPPKDLKSETPEIRYNLIKVRFKQQVSQFVGPEMENFGPFEPGDEAELPEIVANIIVNKGQGERL